MDIIDKSKALNILVPSLINKTENLTKEIKTRIKLNKIFSEFENKASSKLNYFISNSNKRYNYIKLGNNLDLYLLKNRTRNETEVNIILNDKFYKDEIIEKEKQKLKYKSTSKVYKDIKETFNKMKIPLEDKSNKESKRQIKVIINKIKTNLKKSDINLIKSKKNSLIYNNKNISNNKTLNKNNNNINNNKDLIKLELDKDNSSLKNSINEYLNNINNANSNIIQDYNATTPWEILNSKTYKEKPKLNLPNIKLINTSFLYKPIIKRNISKKDLFQKPDINKLLPYSKIAKNKIKFKKKKELSLNNIENNKFPFITEANICLKKTNDYKNTVNIVYNSASKELENKNNFDRKRRKLNEIFGINDIPQLNTYDDILFKKSKNIKTEREIRANRLFESQKFEALSYRERAKVLIDKEINFLNTAEKNLFKKVNLYKKNKSNDYFS